MSAKRKAKKYTFEELWNPQVNLSFDAAAYGRQSTKEQYIEHIQSHISQTIGLLNEAKQVGFKDDGSTGIVTLFVENQVVDGDGNIQIKNASGTWPIDKRPGLKAILDLIEEDKIKLVIVELVDRLFRDEDRIDSNIFIKTCKEHDCFVYVTSKKMIYNFANPQMAEMFRMEVAFAAAYIEHHVRGTMLKRRDMAVSNGRFGGGYTPMGFVVCKEKGDKYNKLTPYKVHADIVNDTGRKILQLGIDEFCRQSSKEPVFFPDFEEGVSAGHRSLKKVDGGYVVNSKSGIIEMVTNPANIGDIEYGDIYVENAHDAIMDKELYNLLRLQLKGSKTNKGRRYYQKNTSVKRIGTLKKLLVSTQHQTCAYYPHDGGTYYYSLHSPGVKKTIGICISASYIESLVENRLLAIIQKYDIGSFEDELKTRRVGKIKRVKAIDTRLSAIDEELENLANDLNKTKVQIMIDKIEGKAKKLEQEVKDLNEEKGIIGKELQEDNEASIEAELSGLDIMKKPASIRQAILELLIKKILLDPVSPKFLRLRIEWKAENWGTDETYIARENAQFKPWTEEEETILLELYPAEYYEKILEALPDRSWASIRQRAARKRIKRVNKKDSIENTDLSKEDQKFLEQMGDNFSPKKWESMGRHKNTPLYTIAKQSERSLSHTVQQFVSTDKGVS